MARQSNTTSAILLVLGSMFVILTAYEVVKQWLFPDITIWRSHVVTMFFGSLVAAIAAWWGTRRFDGLRQQLNREKEKGQRLEKVLHDESAQLNALMENIPDSIYFKDTDCSLTRISRKEMEDLGLEEPSEVIGKTDADLFGKEFGKKTRIDDTGVMTTGEPVVGLVESRDLGDGRLNWTSTTKVPLRNTEGEIVGLVGITREINDLMDTRQALETKNCQLQAALHNLKTLKGLIPICASCKKVRDDEGFWQQVEVYVRDHSEAEFSHGLCPDCIQRLFPDSAPEA
jgi:PAS domain S-box-containing protein